MRRTRIAAVAAAAAVAGALGTLQAAPPSAASSAPPTGIPSSTTGAPTSGASTSVTLITGDVVTVTGAETDEPTYVVAPSDPSRGDVTFAITRTPSATYIVPSDVADLVGPDLVLDQELFNVTRLVDERLDDASRPALPLIIQTSDGQALGAGVPGLSQGRGLTVLGAHEATLRKSGTASLGRHLGRGRARAADPVDVRRAKGKGAVPPKVELQGAGPGLDGISRIWLDGEVKASDWDANLTQVGAPSAWSDGVTGSGVKVAVLDTGIDLEHPDLAGKVLDTANFSGTASIADKVGHGTHVAGTIAGTGAAAAGIRRGVAPDAQLLIGKVLGDDGRGDLSNSVLGMEWAVDNGAKVVNMSLGSVPTDGTDPVSEALDQLSADSGTLFVVAAGNTGPGPNTVTAPSVADRALSVAAVDGAGAVAAFSSRGPRVGDDGLKPEIAAPGVAITAPRSSLMTGPAGAYTTMSGTSMATPHVVGIAALVAQKHPDWSGDRIKAALMTTTRPATTGGVFDVGAGQAFAPAALAATLVADRGAVTENFSEGQDERTSVVTVTNTSDQPVTASVAADAGQSGSASLVTVSPATLTLAPGASAPVTVTVDGSALPGTGSATGRLTITPSSGSTVTVPVVATRSRWVTVRATTTSGQPAPGAFVAILNQTDGRYLMAQTNSTGSARVPMSPGALSVTTTIQEQGPLGPVSSVVPLDVPAGVNEVTTDARTAVPIGAQVGQTTREEMGLYGLIRLNNTARTYISNAVIAGGAYGPIERGQLRIAPTTTAPEGTVWLSEHWILANKGSSNVLGDATKVYDLAFSGETVPARPVHDLDQAAVKGLAVMDTDFTAPGVPFRSQFATTVIGPGITGLNVATPSYIAAPVRQTRYFTPGDLLWRFVPFRGKLVPGGSISMNLEIESRRFTAGESVRNSFWAGPLGAGATATLSRTATGAALTGAFTDFVDSAGHGGSYAEFTFPSRGQTVTEVWRDGVKVGNRLSTSPLSVPAEAARYRLVRSYASDDVFPIGGTTRTVWETEPVAASGSGAVGLPLTRLVWSGQGLDRSNRATAGADTAIEVSATSSALDPADRSIAATEAMWTTDGGTTWTSATVRQQGPAGTYRFTVPGTALQTGGWVGLRFNAVDVAGNRVAQTVLRAFPVG